MTSPDPIAAPVAYALRDALTTVRGHTELLVRHLDVPAFDVTRTRADAAKVLACVTHLEAVLAQHDVR